MKKQMRDLVEKYGTDFRKIGDIMGRIPGDCKDNWRKAPLLCLLGII